MANDQPKKARDLADFHLRWPEFRRFAESVKSRQDLTEQERETLDWMINLADRIGPADIGPDVRKPLKKKIR